MLRRNVTCRRGLTGLLFLPMSEDQHHCTDNFRASRVRESGNTPTAEEGKRFGFVRYPCQVLPAYTSSCSVDCRTFNSGSLCLRLGVKLKTTSRRWSGTGSRRPRSHRDFPLLNFNLTLTLSISSNGLAGSRCSGRGTAVTCALPQHSAL